MTVTADDIRDGLRALGLDRSSAAIVHSSLRSFGHVSGGASAVCQALVDVCGTVLMPAAAGGKTRIVAPPGLVRPNNACRNAATWTEFELSLQAAVPFTPDLPIDRELGRIPETMRREFRHVRSEHPSFSYLAVGTDATRMISAQRLDHPLGPIEELADAGGDVVLLGVTHTSNTAIHLAEQRRGRSRFYRYAKTAPGRWQELPNIPGESHSFDELELPAAAEVRIGGCPALRYRVRDVLDAAGAMIDADPRALLCADDPECRCAAALAQYLSRAAV